MLRCATDNIWVRSAMEIRVLEDGLSALYHHRDDLVAGCCRLDCENELGYAARKKEVRMQAYCVKCRTKRDVKNPKSITMKNGRPATQGLCPVCGTKVFRIGKG